MRSELSRFTRFITIGAVACITLLSLPQFGYGSDTITNPRFVDGADGWEVSKIASDKEAVAHTLEIVSNPTNRSESVLHLATFTEAGYTGEESHTQIAQTLTVTDGVLPTIEGEYFVPPEVQTGFGGFYVLVTLYNGEERLFDALMHNGAREERAIGTVKHLIGNTNNENAALRDYRRRVREGRWVSYRLNDQFRLWHRFRLNLTEVTNTINEKYPTVNITDVDRVVVTAGTWSGNDANSGASILLRELGSNSNTEAPSFFADQRTISGFMNHLAVYASAIQPERR